MTEETNNRKLGAKAERAVAEYLESRGFVILETNYRCRQGEIDLIAREQEYYVFIEVKYRNTAKYGMPQEAVGRAKQKRICNTAKYYLYRHQLGEFTPVRFDVAAIAGDRITYVKNAFDMI
ncbi:MAG: YraN family protein [Bacteroidales bacterium]|nr:YraN family protein [Clostridium sp.]MCM1203048.1 YraN family protein [Bacteroidales bacterium]